MKKKKRIIIFSIIISILLLAGIVFYIFTKEDKNSTLNLLEKQWIENNKNEMIDLGIVNNIAILNYSTDSLIFNFIEDLENTTGLDFNEISYEYGEKIEEDYAFMNVSKVKKNDILVYSDNYVLIGKNKLKYNDLTSIKSGVVGVKTSDLESVNKYLDNGSLTYKSYDADYYDIIKAFQEDGNGIDYIAMPKLLFLSFYEEYENLYINYNITEIEDNYVIRLGKKDRLNDIFTKYYKKWHNENYNNLYTSEFSNMYYKIYDVDEKEKVNFRSKRYTYGFVENAPYDIEVNGKLYGINNTMLKGFSEMTDAEITYKSYSSVKKLKEAFNTNKIDFMHDKYSEEKYDIDVYNTVSIFDENVLIISPNEYNLTINSLNSLADLEIATLGNTMLEEAIKGKCKKIKTYSDIKDMLNYRGVILIDLLTYNFYNDSFFEDYKVDYMFGLNKDYSYLVRDISNNKVFEEFFDFYLTYINETVYLNNGFQEALAVSEKDSEFKNLAYLLVVVVTLIIILFVGNRFNPGKNNEKKRKVVMKKEDKLKYVDMLTSLKNRNYLNDNIERWDESEIYPQSIVIIDLNNIAYINDNYGHQEGDAVIKEAANKLINSQIANSDIIRTNGNEFLIYLVGYEEKEIVAYIKKLNKDLKELAHGFGAAIGYSMITDGIKTIDDAVNEATLDMRYNKEELNN